ncbi:MAG: 4Fe-4S binding protein [Candidatus Marinimicrobia bacterium]|nr:4Fe-4S binding protein [Candidatus Neomarinimicrobiota bacterium]
MSNGLKKRIVKEIKVNLDKCIGCRACEMACSGFHAEPKFSSTNPARSRIRVIVEDRKDVYLPIRAGDYSSAECAGRNTYTINGKDYSQCSFCTVSCPSRDLFKEPDSDLPLKCDMCESVPPLAEPMCVQVCCCDALTYVEREEDVAEEEVRRDEIDMGLESLISKHGINKVVDTVAKIARISKS